MITMPTASERCKTKQLLNLEFHHVRNKNKISRRINRGKKWKVFSAVPGGKSSINGSHYYSEIWEQGLHPRELGINQ
jgi:hypothetical protein